MQVNIGGLQHGICNLKYSIPKEITNKKIWRTIYLYSRSCWKIHKFSVPIEKEVNQIAKNGEETTKTISYKLKFIDSTRFMASSLSNLDKILAKEIHKIKCKYRYAKQMQNVKRV